jgi:hypothetical protein
MHCSGKYYQNAGRRYDFTEDLNTAYSFFDQRGMKRQEVGENCIMRSFITCILLQV